MKIILLIIILMFSVSCQSVKDGLTMKKKNNSDEFLIEKKNPLILPPEYGNLPKPKNNEEANNQNETNKIKSLLDSEKKIDKSKTNTTSNLESLILKEIKSE
jgi:hypothetical protein